MYENDEGGDQDQGDQFHRNAAISAVADEGFVGEEGDEYEDLYNDVINGDGFLQSLRKNDDSGVGNEEMKKNEVATVSKNPSVSIPGGSGTILFVGDLQWWTTDAELEAELCKYGPVKEVKFFDEEETGKSMGYCQVEFYDASASIACKEGLNGHSFYGRPCVVALASPNSVKRMGEAQVNRTRKMAQSTVSQTSRGPSDVQGNYQGGGDSNSNSNSNRNKNANNGGFGRVNWGRGNRRGFMGGRGIVGNGGNGFGPGFGAAPRLLHQQGMMAQGFGPSFGAPIRRMGPYGGFPGAPAPPFPGILSSFPPVGYVGLPGVATLVNPSFFGRGMPAPGVDGPKMGMWADPDMGGWVGEEAGSEHRDKERERGRDRARSKRKRDRNRDRDKEDRDGYRDQHRHRDRDADYGKRRRQTSE